jgi:hypothetical protein
MFTVFIVPAGYCLAYGRQPQPGIETQPEED